LGSVQYPVSQRISMVAEKVLFLDPFDKRLFQTCMSACSSCKYYGKFHNHDHQFHPDPNQFFKTKQHFIMRS
jgi:hypothetical protein